MRNMLFALIFAVGFVQSCAAQSAIFLVRHAEKAEAGTNDPKDPELSKAGRARAESLAKVLRDSGITAIYTTEFKRTQQTANRFASVATIKPTIVPAKDSAALIAKLQTARGNVLVVGHSNTLPEVIKALGVQAAPSIPETDYDDLFIVVPGAPPQLIRLHYRGAAVDQTGAGD